MNSLDTRRAFIQASAAIGSGLLLSACGRSDNAQSGKQKGESDSKKEGEEEGCEVTATECNTTAGARSRTTFCQSRRARNWERRTPSRNGFENAVKQVGEIEGMLGLTDISQFTAPPPKA